MITTILWDIDGTLLDFEKAESFAIKSLFAELCLGECSDEMIARYSAINKKYWERLERGELSKQQILIGRFADFFTLEGLDASLAEIFNSKYQLRLGDTIAFCDSAYDIVKALKGRVKQYAVSNGTVAAQTKKLKLSGLQELFDGVFLSDELGAEKPDIEFFKKVFASIEETDRSKILIVGDSLTSDIQGGNNAEILCCWYNPKKKIASHKLKIDYEIGNLSEIFDIL